MLEYLFTSLCSGFPGFVPCIPNTLFTLFLQFIPSEGVGTGELLPQRILGPWQCCVYFCALLLRAAAGGGPLGF